MKYVKWNGDERGDVLFVLPESRQKERPQEQIILDVVGELLDLKRIFWIFKENKKDSWQMQNEVLYWYQQKKRVQTKGTEEFLNIKI